MSPKPPRPGSHRDVYTPKHGTACIPTEVDENITDRYEGEELRERRSLREPEKRIERLEDKHDKLVTVVTEMRVEVAEMSGKLEVLPDLVQAVQQSTIRAREREHVTFTAQVDLDKAKGLDVISAGAAKREWITQLLKIIGGAIAIAVTAFAAGRC